MRIFDDILFFTKRFFSSIFDGIVNFVINILGIPSETDLISKEIRKSIVLLSVSFLMFFIFFILIIALFLSPSPTVKVPNIVGDEILDALRKVENAGLIPSLEFVVSEEHPRGIVIKQIPSPGNTVREGKTMKIFVSIGSGEFIIPDFSGKPLEDVKSFLYSRGATASIEYIQSSYETGLVVKTLPPAGSKVKPNTPIVIYVSTGSEDSIPMPNFLGMNYENALLFLDSKNIKFKITPTPTSDPASDGIVLNQIPQEGEILPKDGICELTVGVFGEENQAQNTRFILYKTSLYQFSKENVSTYYIEVEVKDQADTRIIKRTLTSLTTLILPLKIRGIATIKITINGEVVKQETL